MAVSALSRTLALAANASLTQVCLESLDLPFDYNRLAVDEMIAKIAENTIPGFISYRTVEQTFSDLEQLAADNPNIASWLDIGDSYDKITPGGPPGYDIYALELTNKNTNGSEPKPTLYVMGSLHSREYTGAELATRFGEQLVENYGDDPDITWLLDYFKVAIVPIANPDGRKFAEQGYLWRDRKSTRLNSSHSGESRMPSSA